jgi:methylated-DNA-[protein]-cysteine S-methyltransferase
MKPAHQNEPTPPLQLSFGQLQTPIGVMLVLTDHAGNLRAIDWSEYESRMRRLLRLHYGADRFKVDPGIIPRNIADAIKRYFSGELATIDTLPVATAGTIFQRAVWTALRNIPPGVTTTYAELALLLGKPAALRAVGHANGSNPVGVVIPCHRVIGKDGSLTGYGGGLERKRWLLHHEARILDGAAHVSRQQTIVVSPPQI